jgi:hypothetical protein
MIDPVACAAMELGSPHVSLAALLELHKLLIQRRLRRGSPDGFTIAEMQNEDLATTGTIARDRSPAQHAARLAEAEGAEFGATDDRDRPTR